MNPIENIMQSHYVHPKFSDYARLDGAPSKSTTRASSFPLVSVVTPTFNSGETLAETIESVRSQDYPNIEFIVVDANSTDNTRHLVSENRDLITTYCREQDRGIYDGINKGIGLATGDIVKITNADDVLEPGSVSTAVRRLAMASDPSRTIINSYLNIINQASELVDLFSDKWIVESVPAFLHPSWYVPIQVYREFGLYSLELKVASDYEYFLYIRQKCEFVTLERPLTAYRTDGRSSGFEGMYEAIEISRKYLDATDASKIQRAYWIQKLRKRLLFAMFGERGFYAIKHCVKRFHGKKAGK